MHKWLFYKKVYLHVAFAFLLFLVLEYFFLGSEIIVNAMLSFLDWYLRLVLLWLFTWATYLSQKMALNKTNKIIQYGWLVLYTVAEALLFVPLLVIVLWYTEDFSLLIHAVVLTFALFWGLSVVAITSKKDFSMLRSILYIWSFIGIGLIITGIIFWFTLGLWFSFWMIVLASIAILYQTSKLVHDYDEDQYIAASLWLFSSLMLMLWYVIRIFLALRR